MRSRPLWQLCDTAPERKRGRAAWFKTRSGRPATPLNRGLAGLNGRLVGLPFAAVSHEQRCCQLVGVQRPWGSKSLASFAQSQLMTVARLQAESPARDCGVLFDFAEI
jgi:hypothetical protein